MAEETKQNGGTSPGFMQNQTFLYGFVALVFSLALPALIISCVAFQKLPSQCAASTSTLEETNTTTYVLCDSSKGTCGPVTWNYSDTSWAAFPTCKASKVQSPIDIKTARWPADPSLPVINASNFQDGSMYVSNAFMNKCVLTLSPNNLLVASGIKGFFQFKGVWYKLDTMQFHTPSEHTVDGFSELAELELIHKDKNGNFLIISVLFNTDGDKTDDSMKELLTGYPETPQRPPETKPFVYFNFLNYALDQPVNVENGTRVAAPGHNAAYWTYTGSLTTPPCTEGVTYIVLSKPRSMSAIDLNKLKRVMGGTSRPIQPLYGRSIYAH